MNAFQIKYKTKTAWKQKTIRKYKPAQPLFHHENHGKKNCNNLVIFVVKKGSRETTFRLPSTEHG